MAKLLLFVLLLCAGVVDAHPLLQNVMWVQFEPTRIHVAVNVSVREIAVAQSLAASSDNFDNTALATAAEKHAGYVLQHLAINANGQSLTGKLLHITDPPILTEPEKTYYQYELEFPLTGPPPAKVTIVEDMLREWSYALGTPWDVNYIVRLKHSGSDEIIDGDRIAVAGFCQGGGFALIAGTSPGFSAAAVNYGAVPSKRSKLDGVCPVVAGYGARDRLFGRAMAERLEDHLSALGVPHDVKVYDGAGHSFFSKVEGGWQGWLARLPSPMAVGYEQQAAEDGWGRMLGFFSEHV